MRIGGIIVLICVVLAAVYFGWLHFGTSDRSDQSSLTVTVDKDKIREDKEKIKERAEDLSEQTREKIHDLTDKPATVPATAPTSSAAPSALLEVESAGGAGASASGGSKGAGSSSTTQPVDPQK